MIVGQCKQIFSLLYAERMSERLNTCIQQVRLCNESIKVILFHFTNLGFDLSRSDTQFVDISQHLLIFTGPVCYFCRFIIDWYDLMYNRNDWWCDVIE